LGAAPPYGDPAFPAGDEVRGHPRETAAWERPTAVAIVAASVTRDDPTDGIADSASALPAEPPATPLLPPKLLKLLSGVA